MPFPFRPALIAAAALFCALPLAAQEKVDSGAYLAARIAAAHDDYRAAAQWYTRALIASPDSNWIMDGAVVAQLGAGNMEGAIAVSRRLLQNNGQSQPADIAMLADKIKREDFAGLLADLENGVTIGLLLDGLVRAWAELGTGQMSEALQEFDTLAQTKGLEAFGLYHKALALASVGDFEGAEKIFSGNDGGTIRVMRRGTVAHAQILSQLERNAEAVTLLDTTFTGETDPAIDELRAKLVAGDLVPYDITRNVTDGMAEVFFTLAVALNGEASDGYTLIYSRVAGWLRPDHAEAQLLSGGMLENQDQFDLAVEAYAKVPREDGGFFAAELGRARSLEGAGKLDAALEVLTALTRSHPDLISVHVSLGNMLRIAERWPEATAAYDAAIAVIPEGDRTYWSTFYSRAITLERQKIWPRAEADFRIALALEPDQPQVLNYLGYSYLERGENLDEALSMIERAVAQRPDSGYIIDSLAWGYFLLGRYEEAVDPMERASVLEPVDPTVTDHLGDVYWAVGRKLEANFQWRRALSFDPEQEVSDRLRRKLEIGLDAVRVEEGAKPLSEVANDL
ncbi:MAG: tetratricopeptide (TPR) repeat protein [Pseudorhodobacter sp.]|jgi:tetratricopeptide (TPR) repeat protein